MNHLVYRRTPQSRTTVHLDGVDISRSVISLELRGTPDHDEIVLGLAVRTETVFDLEAAHVCVDPSTATALKALGWTPPCVDGWKK